MMIKITSFLIFVLPIVIGNFFVSSKVAQASVNALNQEVLIKYKNKEKVELRFLKEGQDQDKYIKMLLKDKNIEYVEPNFVYKQAIIPSDTYYDKQWYFKKIKAFEAWDVVKESKDIVIAVLDSGVQIDHPDLKDNIWRNIKEAKNDIDDDKNGYIDDVYGWDFINKTGDPGPKFNKGFNEAGVMHGTIVAGIAAARGNNALGVSGVTWRAKLMSLKVLDDNGEGRTDKVVEAIDYAIKHDVDIINLSFVGFGNSKSLEHAIERAHNAGIIIVAAAGNDQGQGDGYFLDDTPMYPACHDGPIGENWVIGVAATDALDQKTAFSSYGFRCVDIAAPGVSIFTTSIYAPLKHYEKEPFNQYYQGYWSGTSMAVPMVTGAVALIKAVNPSLDKHGIYNVLFEKSDNISRLNQKYLGRLGNGRLNIGASVKYASYLLQSQKQKIIVVPNKNSSAMIRFFEKSGEKVNEFMLFDKKFLGGANLASCDLDGDGSSEILAGAGNGGGPQVRVFNSQGELKMQFFAFDLNFLGGVDVDCGDLNNDGFVEIIVGAGNGGGPHVRIFDIDGKLRGSFFAYDPRFRGGVNVSVGDIDGDGNDEIVTGAGVKGGPHVRIFNGHGKVTGHFFAFDKKFRDGVNVAIAKFNGFASGKKEKIVVSQVYGGDPMVKIFNNHGKVLRVFYAYDKKFRGGVNIATGDIDKDGYDEVVTGAGFGGAPHVRIFEYNGKFINSFYAFEKDFSGGVAVGVVNTN